MDIKPVAKPADFTNMPALDARSLQVQPERPPPAVAPTQTDVFSTAEDEAARDAEVFCFGVSLQR